MSENDNSSGPSIDLEFGAAESVYPELKAEFLQDRCGCIGGSFVRLAFLLFAVALPASLAKSIGDAFEWSWGGGLFALGVFGVLSGFIFTVIGNFLRENLGGPQIPGVFEEVFESDPLLRRLSRDAQLAFLHLGRKRKALYRFKEPALRFRDMPRPISELDTVFKGPGSQRRIAKSVTSLAKAGLVSLDHDRVTFLLEGARKYRKLLDAFLRLQRLDLQANRISQKCK